MPLIRYQYISSDGKRGGPCTADELRDLYIDAELDKLAMISSSEDSRLWMPLEDSPVFAYMPRPPSVAPPPRSSGDIKSMRFTKEACAARKSLRIASNRRSTRTASQRFLRVPVLDTCQYLWVQEEIGSSEDDYDDDDSNVWSLCNIVSQDNTILELQNLESSRIFKIDLGFTEVMKYNDSIVSDMAFLANIHEPGILYNIHQRYTTGHPYTFIGSVLLAVNPFLHLQHPAIHSSGPIPPSPHPFLLAEWCYRSVVVDPTMSHTVIISGESGAGKSETAKLITGHLVSMAHSPNQMMASSVEKRIVRSTAVFDAFGSAKTSNCPCSSRFIKYTKLYISESGAIGGAGFDIHMFEKSRVTSLHRNDVNSTNYNIFYEVLASWDEIGQRNNGDIDLGSQDLSWGSNYKILSTETDWRESLPQSELQRKFCTTEDSLTEMGWHTESMTELWGVVAVIILLGELDFIEEETLEGLTATVDDQHTNICYTICRILGISREDLEGILTHRVIYARGESFVMSLSQVEAYSGRDAICRALYSYVFRTVVAKMNQAMLSEEITIESSAKSETGHALPTAKSRPYVGILDTFGVEENRTNGLEQLFINYSNEVLRNEYNKQIFEKEIALLSEESIECPVKISSCPNNSLCVEMMHTEDPRLKSIFSLLDAGGRCPKPTDLKFCLELHNSFGKENHDHSSGPSYGMFFLSPHLKDKRNKFLIKHYSGKVTYTVSEENDWVLGNIDAIPDKLSDLLASSALKILRKFIDDSHNMTSACETRKRDQKKLARRPSQISLPTIASKLASSMSSLLNALQTDVCSHILCVKPNTSLKPGVFNKRYVLRQMRALGCVKTCEIMKVGLPDRISFSKIKSLWGNLLDKVQDICVDEADDTIISLMLQSLGLSGQSYRLGKSVVFLEKYGLLRLHELMGSADGDFTEVLLKFQKSLNNKRETKVLVDGLSDEVSRMNQLISSGKTELDDLQNRITSMSQQSEGSSSIALVVSTNDMHSAVESTTCLLDIIGKRVEDLKNQVSASSTNKKEIAFFNEVESIDRLLQVKKSLHSSILSEVEGLERSSRSHISVRLQDAALDRWQSVAKSGELAEQAKMYLADATRAASRCQLEVCKDMSHKCRSAISMAEKNLNHALDSAHEAIDQLNLSKQGKDTIVHDTQDLTARVEKVAESCHALLRKCDNVDKKKPLDKASSVTPKTPADELPSPPTAREMRRAGSIRLGSSDSIKILQQAASSSSFEFGSDSDDDFSPIIVDIWIVPEGWEEVFDIPSQTPYYFNTITLMSQWERPTEPAQSNEGSFLPTIEEESSSTPSSSVSSTPQRTHKRKQKSTLDKALAKMVFADRESPNMTERKVLKSTSVRFEDNDSASIELVQESGPNSPPHHEVVDKFVSSVVAIKGEEAKTGDLSKQSSHSEEPPSKSKMSRNSMKCNLSHGRTTTRQLDRMGVELKRGFLLVKEGFLSRWKKRYFVLEGSRLSYFKDIDGYHDGIYPRKVMTLGKDSVTAYTDARFTFSVKTTGCGTWLLVAESEETMRQWVTYINAHIHWMHRRLDVSEYDSSVMTSDCYWLEGVAERSFWRLPLSYSDGSSVAPLPILSLPRENAPRTGEALHPGEYLEVSQLIEVSGQIFLRLADDRGWVRVYHHKNKGNLLTRARECICHEVNDRVLVDDAQIYGLAVCFGPGDDSPCTGQYVWPGEAFELCLMWTIDQVMSTGNHGSSEKCRYGKLGDGRGWVRAVDKDGRILLHSLS